MSPQIKKCAVPGCSDCISRRHRFPNPRRASVDIINIWLSNVNNPMLINLTHENLHSSYYVCDRHFADDNKVPFSTKCNRGLMYDAVPTLHLHSMDLATCILPTDKLTPVTPQTLSSSAQVNADFKQDTAPVTPPLLSSGAKRRISILHEVNVTRQADLTPKCRKFYKKIVNWGVRNRKLQSSLCSFRKRLENAEHLASSGDFNKFINDVNDTTYTFICQQLKNQKICAKARRFTVDEKILSLSILKSSAKGYRFLSKIFALPSRRTLTNFLNRIPFRPGINEQIFQAIQNSVQNMNIKDRCCVLLFDELSIQANLSYNKKEDYIEGLEDNGTSRRNRFATHANVFMLRGLCRQWKQPISFSFSYGPIKTIDLKCQIVKLIEKAHTIGLDIVGTICDQGSANQAAINLLIKETREKYGEQNKHFGFSVNDMDIIPLYDIPHLFKGIRNNLLNKNLHFTLNGIKRIAKWDHIVQFYNLDTEDDTRMCPKLTDQHVLPSKINKMKVSYCTQVFSYQVGSLMKRIAKWEFQDKYLLVKEALDTAELILFLDVLFDSLNANYTVAPSSKPLKGGVSKTAVHRNFWMQYLDVLGTMKFYSTKKNGFVFTPSVSNLIKTIKGVIYLTDLLLAKKRFTYVLTRTLNQDPLENFFSAIRSHGIRNTHPDVSHFTSSFKSLIINNFMTAHSPASNCDEDHAFGLENLRCFLTGESISGVKQLDNLNDIPFEEKFLSNKKTRVAINTITYIAGYVASKALANSKNCASCKELLTSFNDDRNTEFIEARAYKSCELMKPGRFLNFIMNRSLSLLFYILPRVSQEFKLCTKLENYMCTKVDFTPLKCQSHNLNQIVSNLIVKCVVYFWCKRINLILKGKDFKFLKHLNSLQDKMLIDPMKQLAHALFLKQHKRK